MISLSAICPSLIKYLPNWLERFYPNLAQFARGEGYPCGNQGVFIPRRNKCWTHPKTGQRLKKPLTYQLYKEAKEKSQRSRTEKGRTALETREQGFRDKAREKVKGWQKNKPQEEVKPTPKPKSHSDYYGISSEDQKLLDASPLQGTEKQVTWAEKLRKDSIIQARLEASLYGELLTKDNPNGEKLSVDDFKEVSDLIGKYAATKKDAKFWIDRRFNSKQEDIVRPVMTAYVERLAEKNDPRLSNELKEIALKNKSKRIGADQERKLLAEKYQAIKKPDLEGTDRQVNWAAKIRDGFLGDAERQGIDSDSVQKALDSEEFKNSKFWIENRDLSMQGNRLSKEGIEKIKKFGNIKKDNLKEKNVELPVFKPIPGSDEYDDWLENKIQELKWDKRKIRVKTPDGYKEVDGIVSKGLSVNNSKDNFFAVTHVKSGKGFGVFQGKKQAQKIVVELQNTDIDWNKDDIMEIPGIEKKLSIIRQKMTDVVDSDTRRLKRKNDFNTSLTLTQFNSNRTRRRRVRQRISQFNQCCCQNKPQLKRRKTKAQNRGIRASPLLTRLSQNRRVNHA